MADCSDVAAGDSAIDGNIMVGFHPPTDGNMTVGKENLQEQRDEVCKVGRSVCLVLFVCLFCSSAR